MSLKEIHALQSANNLEAIGPLLASYATSYFYRESHVFRNLRRMPNGIEATDARVFVTSPTKIATLREATPHKLKMCARPIFSLSSPLSQEEYKDIIECISIGIDRAFLNLVCNIAKMPPMFETSDLEQLFADCLVKGQLYFSGVECSSHFEDVPRQRIIPEEESAKFSLEGPWYQLSLCTEFCVSVDNIVVPTNWSPK